MADNKIKFLRGTSNEYAAVEKDNDTIYFTTDDGKLYIGDKEVSGESIKALNSHINDNVKHITSTERTNWNAAKTHADSAHAPSNAQANVIETIKVNGTALTPSSKAVNITVPTVGNGTITITQNGSTKGTFTTNQSGNTTIALDDNNTVYTHPTYTAKSSGLYKVTVDGTGHVSAATAVTKADITALGIPASDTNTHYASKNVVGGNTATSNTTTALTNGNVYLNSVENGAVTSAHKISGSGATTVTTDASGNIVISSTDNNTWRDVVDNLTSTDATKSLSANQGKILKGLVDGKAAASHTHSAYVNQNAFSNITVGSTTIAADTATDTLTLVGSNVTLTPDATNDKVTIGITKANVTSALGYTPPTTNTTYEVATQSTDGLMSAADKTILDKRTAYKLVSSSCQTVSINTSDWNTLSSGGYVCEKTLPVGLLYDNYIFDVSLSSDTDAAKLQLQSWNYIMADGRIEQATSSVNGEKAASFTFYAFTTKPTVALTIAIQGVSGS